MRVIVFILTGMYAFMFSLSLFVQTTEGTGDKAQDQEGWSSWYSQRGLRKYGTIPSCTFQGYGLIVLGDKVCSYQI